MASKMENNMKNDLRMTNHPILDIRRGKRISFQFNGRKIFAYEGETIAAALYASGVRIFSRSFKYHRPRGLFCMAGHCSNCLMRVDGVPNMRVCREPVRPGAVVASQNAWPSLRFDIAALTGYLSFLFRPGFQYRRFIRPRWAYHIWEKFLRRMAGIGSLADIQPSPPTKRRTASPEIVVVGGGIAGLSAALHAAQAGAEVMLVEKERKLGGRELYDTSEMEMSQGSRPIRRFEYAVGLARNAEQLGNCSVLKNGTAFAWYDEGILAVSRPGEFWELKPERTIVATGSYETPSVFDNNDLPGIFTAGALQRLMHGYHIRPGNRAVVATSVDDGYSVARQLMEADVGVAGIIDPRQNEAVLSAAATYELKETDVTFFAGHTLKEAIGRRHIRGIFAKPVNNGGKKVRLSCDTLCVVGVRTPANELLFQRTCEGAYILESPHQFTRKPTTSPDMRVSADMFVAGESNGSHKEEHALLEGKIAGLSAALDIGHGGGDVEAARNESIKQLAAVKRQDIR
jgi:sarcosine oxidase subunit alpha